MKKISVAAVAMVALVCSCASCGSNQGANSQSSDSESIIAEVESVAEEDNSSTNWSYSSKIDEMDDSKSEWWTLRSLEPVDLDFPYNEQYVYITVRKMKKYGTDVIVSVNSGQIHGNEYGGTNYIAMRFDGAPMEKWYFSEADDASSEAVFIKKTQAMIKKLEASKDIMLEIPFFDNGRKVVKFKPVSPLDLSKTE